MAAELPNRTVLQRRNTHRLIPSRYAFAEDGSPVTDSVLTRIADNDSHLADIFELDRLSNERDQREHGLLDGIGPEELVFGIPYSRTINASFTHANPLGSRFNGPHRGAWYAAFEVRTAQAEIAFHKSVELAEFDWAIHFDGHTESVCYDDYLADFAGRYHDIRNADQFADCLNPDSYLESQLLAERLLAADSQGIVYPSVRRASGTCLACFRPALIYNVRRAKQYRFTWHGPGKPSVEAVH